MNELLKWILILGFGWLFMGWHFFLFVLIGAVVALFLGSYFPNWFK